MQSAFIVGINDCCLRQHLLEETATVGWVDDDVTIILDLAATTNQLKIDLKLDLPSSTKSIELVSDYPIEPDPGRPQQVRRSTQQPDFSYD